MALQSYFQWASPYTSVPPIRQLLFAIPSMPIPLRKCALAYTRVRTALGKERTLFMKVFAVELREYVSYYESPSQPRTLPTVVSLQMLLEGIGPFRRDPVTQGFLSTIIRSAPYADYSSVYEAQQSTIVKELDAALSTTWNAPLNYLPFFSSKRIDRYTRVFPNLTLDANVHQSIYRAFTHSRSLLDRTMLFPRLSDKTIGLQSQEYASYQLNSGHSELVSMTEIRTIRDVEEYYHRHGVRLRGVVEMRSAWKFNDLKPRVYYAQGPDCYHVSKYVQAIFNIILDCFQVTHRFNRFQLPEAKMNSYKDRLATYDYSSFTSRLEELKAFTRALASFYHGVKVICVDTWEGCIERSLEELLLDYTEICNESSEMDLGKLLDLDDFLILRHTTGMLGVPGNISSATLLHGLHLCCLLGSISAGRCVGDDALAILWGGTDDECWDMFLQGVQNLGMIAPEKFTYWDYEAHLERDGWQYLKRPMGREECLIYTGDVITFPGLELLADIDDDIHVKRQTTPLQDAKKFIAQWSRLLTRIDLMPSYLNETNVLILLEIQKRGFFRHKLGMGGIVQFAEFPHKLSLIAPWRLQAEQFGTGWKHITQDHIRDSGEVVACPQQWYMNEECCGAAGESFVSSGTKLLGLLDRLGYVERKIEMTSYRWADISSPDFLDKLCTLDYPFSYRYTVLHDFPAWASDVSRLMHMSPHERISVIPTQTGNSMEVEEDDITGEILALE